MSRAAHQHKLMVVGCHVMKELEEQQHAGHHPAAPGHERQLGFQSLSMHAMCGSSMVSYGMANAQKDQ